MNTLALCDGTLGLVATGFAWRGRTRVDARLAGGLIAAAALFGVLRYVALLPDPRLHRLLSLLAGALGLPSLAHALLTEARRPATAPRAAALGLALLALAAWLVPTLAPGVRVASVASVFALVVHGTRRRSPGHLLVGACLLAAFVGVGARLAPPGLAPEDVLHLGMAAALLVAMRLLRLAA